MDPRCLLGRRGEDIAASLYRGMGFVVLERNYRCDQGEIDVVAARGELLVFCEVKTRTTNRWGEPCEAVDGRKQRRLRRLAGRWLREHRARARDIRFDVVSIVMRDGREETTLIPDAF